MGLTIRGKRDGTGPFRDSFQRRNFGRGRRKELGEECPFDSKNLKEEIELEESFKSKKGGFRL